MTLYPQRSKMAAFILNFIPGLGHYYMGRKLRGVIYPMLFFGGILFGVMVAIALGEGGMFFAFTLLCAAILWGICMLDLIVYLVRMPAPQPGYPPQPYPPHWEPGAVPYPGGYSGQGQPGFPGNGPEFAQEGMYAQQPYPPYPQPSPENERFFTILLSFIPGLGHLHMGLMQRGLSFLIAFFGLGTVMFFLTGLTSHAFFMLFLGILPIIWLYCMFDAVQLIHRKQAGERVEDRTLFDEMEAGRAEGRRSKVLATLLSAFPGAGHMYLGLQKRGLQLMVIFLGSVYILDLLRLSLFMFLIPLIWFYAFFDGLQQTSRYGREPLIDRPVIEGIKLHQKWLGIGLMALGVYYIATSLIIPELEARFPEFHIDYRISHYLKTAIVALLLIGVGIRLLTGPKPSGRERSHGDF